MTTKKEIEKADELFSYLEKETPNQMASFGKMMHSIEQDGKLSSKVKEAVALGIAIKAQCPGCIAFHVKKAIQLGYNKEEILEIAWVAVLMGDGPSLIYMSYVKEALEEFAE